MAAMSLGFIVLVTPWTIQEIVATCTGSKVIGVDHMNHICRTLNSVIFWIIPIPYIDTLSVWVTQSCFCQLNTLLMCVHGRLVQLPPFFEFLVTWTAISNSFWNPFLYWLLNAHFRRLAKDIIFKRVSFRMFVDEKLTHFYLFQYFFSFVLKRLSTECPFIEC